MKRVLRNIFLILIISTFLINSIYAQDSPSKQAAEQLGINSSYVPDNPQDIKGEYLKQAWGNFISENKYLSWINPFLTKLNPLFKFALGVEWSFSLAFFLAIFIWFLLFLILYEVTKPLFGKDLFAFIGSLVLASLIGYTGAIRGGVDVFSKVIKTWWMAAIMFLFFFVIYILIIRFSGNIHNFIEQLKEDAGKKQQNEDRQIIHMDAENIKEGLGN